MKIFANIVGVLAVAVFLLSYQQKRRGGIIFCNALSRALYILQYLLLGAMEGAVLDLCGILATVLAGKKHTAWMQKHWKLVMLLLDLLTVGAGLLLYRNLFSLLPIVGVLLHTGAFWLENEKKIRFVSLAGSPFWLGYNLYSRAFGSVIGDALSIVSIAVAIVRYDVLGKKKT